MKNLISMTDFVLQDESMSGVNIVSYARFLKQPLELWMFIPCKLVDGVWVVLEKPKFYYTQEALKNLKRGVELDIALEVNKKVEEYQQAKKRCLFEGYDGSIQQVRNLITLKITIEGMVKYGLQLTPTAIKQLQP